jgi:hypothetical protein
MGFILVLAVLSLAVFVCISNTVFNMATSLRTSSRASRLQKGTGENASYSAETQPS